MPWESVFPLWGASVRPSALRGATCTYADLSWFSKTVICFSMLLGRLEIFYDPCHVASRFVEGQEYVVIIKLS